ncbi:tetratricopeptide repeat protein [Aliarcobacter cryaerophilus]|uniref:tetratricopeptide repeat protein n=1 Tax=Aliarcobacter cryaerophilus TaxID=28198 RepID=UPI003DA5EF9F
MKKSIYKIVIIFFILNNFLYANIIESQPQIIFELEKLEASNENLEIQVDFNKAVLHFRKGEYKDALRLFEKTSKVFEAPSLLNMGIIYYKQKDEKKAQEFFNKIYSKKTNLINQPYSFISSCYYLFEITKDDKYMLDLVTIFQNSKKLSEYNELITDIKDAILKELANRYLMIEDYENALGALNAMSYSLDLKKSMILIKLNNFQKASTILKKIREEEKNSEILNKVLWISAYSSLKQNNFEDAQEILDLINDRKKDFNVNIQMPLEIFFNKDLYSYKDYYKSIMKFDEDRMYDFIYYFAPFVFSDSKEIIYDSVKGFIYGKAQSVENLENMVEYNTKFIRLVKQDPIKRVNELKNIIKTDSKAYIYYNLALSYAQINDFTNAYKNFEKAYKLSPGNKLYSVMYLITANKISADIPEKQRAILDKNIKDSGGLYSYFAKELYKLFVNSTYNVVEASQSYEKTVFYKAIDFLKKMNNNENLSNHQLLEDYERDPFIYLLKLVQKNKNEDEYRYAARVQDAVTLKYNNNFLDSSLITSKYYIDILRAFGVFSRVDFNIDGNNNPSYLVTKAYSDLYLGKPLNSIETLKRLKDEFGYENRFTMYLSTASFLESLRPEEASIQISLIKAFYKDKDTDFLTAIQLLQNMNISSAKQFLVNKYNNPYIDFRIVGFEEFMLSL